MISTASIRISSGKLVNFQLGAVVGIQLPTTGCSGHLLLTCLVCRSNRAPALINLPECVYLGV
jgi:hypothetical protein